MYNNLNRLQLSGLAVWQKMGIRFYCPNGHKLNVKSFQAGRRGICPFCGVSLQIPAESTRRSSREEGPQRQGPVAGTGGMGAAPFAQPQDTMPSAAPSGPVAGGMASAPVMPLGETSAVAAGTAMSQPVISQPVQPLGQMPAPSVGQALPGGSGQPAGSAAQFGSTPAVAPLGTAVPTTADLSAAAAQAPAATTPAPPDSGGAVDPLAEAPDVVWYVRPPGGGQFGPATSEIMRAWINEGRVGPDALVWREGWRDWQEASATFPQLGAGQAVSGPDSINPVAVTSGGSVAPGSRAGGGYHAPARRRSNTTNVAIITVLVLAVIILFGVFIWVLFRAPAEASVPTAPRHQATILAGTRPMPAAIHFSP